MIQKPLAEDTWCTGAEHTRVSELGKIFQLYKTKLYKTFLFFEVAILAKFEMPTDTSNKRKKNDKKRLRVSCSTSEDIEEEAAIADGNT